MSTTPKANWLHAAAKHIRDKHVPLFLGAQSIPGKIMKAFVARNANMGNNIGLIMENAQPHADAATRTSEHNIHNVPFITRAVVMPSTNNIMFIPNINIEELLAIGMAEPTLVNGEYTGMIGAFAEQDGEVNESFAGSDGQTYHMVTLVGFPDQDVFVDSVVQHAVRARADKEADAEKTAAFLERPHLKQFIPAGFSAWSAHVANLTTLAGIISTQNELPSDAKEPPESPDARLDYIDEQLSVPGQQRCPTARRTRSSSQPPSPLSAASGGRTRRRCSRPRLSPMSPATPQTSCRLPSTLRCSSRRTFAR
jgi:hypothetical protein